MRRVAFVVVCIVAVACAQPGKPGARQQGNARGTPSDVSRAKVSEVIAPAPRFVDHALLGAELGKDGMVSKGSDKFTVGEPVYLTVVFLESPPGLQTSAVWEGIDKKPLVVERKQMNGGKVATFTFRDPKIKPGHYHVTAYWGGNIATVEQFDVLAAEKVKRKKG